MSAGPGSRNEDDHASGTDGSHDGGTHGRGTPNSTAASPRAWQRKGTVVLVTVLLSLAAFGTTTQTWLTVSLPQGAVQTPDIQIPGSDAATAVTAFALVALASALAVSIAGRIARAVVVGILLIAGAGITVNSVLVAADPAGAAAPAIGESIGVSAGSGAELIGTAFPWAAAVCGLLLMGAAVWMLVAGRSWNRSRRYENVNASTVPAPKTSAHSDEIDSWDQLTKGDDPTR